MKDDLILIPGRIQEMAKDVNDFGVNIPIKDIDVNALTEGDDDPMFVTIEALNEGVSANRVNYSREIIQEITQKVNEIKPDGYMGHLDDKDIDTKNPRSVTLWLGATTAEVNGKLRMFIKGYIPPYATELKTYLRKAKAINKKVSVSIFGAAKKVADTASKMYNLIPGTFVLESIDWARSGRAGVATLGALSITREMIAETDLQPREEIIKSISYDELSMINKNIVKEMKDRYFIEYEPKIREEIEKQNSDRIAEMKKENKELKKEIAIRTLDSLIVGFPDKAKGFVKKMVIAEMKEDDYTEDRVKTLYNNFIQSEEGSVVKEMITGVDVNVIFNNKPKQQAEKIVGKNLVVKKKG